MALPRTKTAYGSSTLITPDPTANTGATLPNYTPESEVYVYTYQLNNTKRAETENGTPLKGAVFQLLYSDADYKNEVKLYQDGEFYYPIKNASNKRLLK